MNTMSVLCSTSVWLSLINFHSSAATMSNIHVVISNLRYNNHIANMHIHFSHNDCRYCKSHDCWYGWFILKLQGECYDRLKYNKYYYYYIVYDVISVLLTGSDFAYNEYATSYYDKLSSSTIIMQVNITYWMNKMSVLCSTLAWLSCNAATKSNMSCFINESMLRMSSFILVP